MTVTQLYNELGKAIKYHHANEEVRFTGKDNEMIVNSWHAANGCYYLVGASVMEDFRRRGESDEL
jgi:hypothetical protein